VKRLVHDDDPICTQRIRPHNCIKIESESFFHADPTS
jgi:hypothetical protein